MYECESVAHVLCKCSGYSSIRVIFVEKHVGDGFVSSCMVL